MQCGFESRSGHVQATSSRGSAHDMSILDALRDRRRRRAEQARAEAERKSQAQGHLTEETNAEGEDAARHPPVPGDLSRWER